MQLLYKLHELESTDSRFDNAYDDIVQHTINNNDWSDCWVFMDKRFQLDEGADDIYLDFLCKVFDPYVRDEKKNWSRFLTEINKLIRMDGYELYVKEYISGREVYGWRVSGVDVADEMSKEALRDLIFEFENGLISKATNGDMNEIEYKRCRDILMNVPGIKEHMPDMIMGNRTAYDFRGFMQGVDQHYEGRRIYIRQLCAYLGIGQTKARELLHDPANGFTVRIGNRLYAHKRKLDIWLENQTM